MEKKTKIRLAGLIILATAVLSLILVLFTDSWPLAIAIAVVVMASASAGFYWYSRRQQRQFIERLKKFDIDPEKAVSTKPICAACITAAARRKKMPSPLSACRRNARWKKRTLCLKSAPPAKSRWRRRAKCKKACASRVCAVERCINPKAV